MGLDIGQTATKRATVISTGGDATAAKADGEIVIVLGPITITISW